MLHNIYSVNTSAHFIDFSVMLENSMSLSSQWWEPCRLESSHQWLKPAGFSSLPLWRRLPCSYLLRLQFYIYSVTLFKWNSVTMIFIMKSSLYFWIWYGRNYGWPSLYDYNEFLNLYCIVNFHRAGAHILILNGKSVFPANWKPLTDFSKCYSHTLN